ncbi:kinesin-like protein KIF9 [Polymixia lowei]
MDAPDSEVRVFVRTRPTEDFAQELIEYLPDGQTVNIRHRKDSRRVAANNPPRSWSFCLDGVLHGVSQDEVYVRVGRGLALRALEGYNGTVICFGQTGAGKTFTMTGTTESYKQRGIIPRILQEVFQEVAKRSDQAFSVHLSYLEIYNETLVDLLSSVRGSSGPDPRGMAVVEEPGRGVSVRGLSLHPVHSEEEALNLLFEGEMNRIVGDHAMNKNSSRSHCIFTLYIESRSRALSDATYVTSKLNLVDLAGSERLGKTGSEGQVFKEARYINKSLSFLEQAILALADPRRAHVPFRQTKLTHALKDSLGGNCHTVLVANVYGEAAQIEETLSTLRFAGRMKRVRTKPTVNVHVHPAVQIKMLQREVQTLREELLISSSLANRPGAARDALPEAQVAEVHSQVQRYLDGTLEEISILSVRQLREVFVQFKLAVQEQEQRVKAQLCQKYNLEEEDRGASSAAVKDGGLEVGVAAPPERHVGPGETKTKKPKETVTASQGKKQGAGSPVSGNLAETASRSKLNPDRTPEDHKPDVHSNDTRESQLPNKEPIGIDSPTPKAEAFEAFKAGRGSEISRILRENKAVLLERRGRLRRLAEEVNAVKREIDGTAASIQRHKDERASQGQFVSAEGELVLDEPEVTLVLRLGELKAQYRERYEELRSTKAEVNYCQHLVDQCRVRLLTEFESWYESFLLPEEMQAMPRTGGPIQPGLIPIDKALVLDDDDQEPLEGLQCELPVDCPSAIFYNAHNKTLKRRNNRASSQTPVQRSSPRKSARKKLLPILPVS